jgi:hypothetical protein
MKLFRYFDCEAVTIFSARACCTMVDWGRQRRLGRWVGGLGGNHPGHVFARYARGEDLQPNSQRLADAHQRAPGLYMILSKKCFDPAVRSWLVCLFK